MGFRGLDEASFRPDWDSVGILSSRREDSEASIACPSPPSVGVGCAWAREAFGQGKTLCARPRGCGRPLGPKGGFWGSHSLPLSSNKGCGRRLGEGGIRPM